MKVAGRREGPSERGMAWQSPAGPGIGGGNGTGAGSASGSEGGGSGGGGASGSTGSIGAEYTLQGKTC